jgi:hypothetical protein
MFQQLKQELEEQRRREEEKQLRKEEKERETWRRIKEEQDRIEELLRRSRPSWDDDADAAPPPPDWSTATLWWEVLGLPRMASTDQIQARYRELAKEHHPDRGGDAKVFMRVQAAYDQARAAHGHGG